MEQEIEQEPAYSCDSYRPGHDVHWIQARKSWEEPGLVEEGVVTQVGEGIVTVQIGPEVRRYRNHDTARFERILRRRGMNVIIQERWRLLKVPSPEGFYCFCIATSNDTFDDCTRPERRRGRFRRTGRRGDTGRRPA